MNFRQISFLHVYYHSSIFAIWWLTVFMAPTGEPYFSATLNSLIHVVMYGYYLASSAGVATPLVRAVKPFITMGQMTQFCCMMFQATFNIIAYFFFTAEQDKANKYPISLNIVLWVYMWTMLGLFANFYVKSYSAAKKNKDAAKKSE